MSPSSGHDACLQAAGAPRRRTGSVPHLEFEVLHNVGPQEAEQVRRPRELEARHDLLRHGGTANNGPSLQHAHASSGAGEVGCLRHGIRNMRGERVCRLARPGERTPNMRGERERGGRERSRESTEREREREREGRRGGARRTAMRPLWPAPTTTASYDVAANARAAMFVCGVTSPL